jgi:hypothetical protein
MAVSPASSRVTPTTTQTENTHASRKAQYQAE